MKFKDRIDAGRQLARKLNGQFEQPVVLALPRGGVVLAAEIARALSAPLDLILVRKIGHPYNPEYAVGAVTADGEAILNSMEAAQLDPGWLKSAIDRERTEAQRRRQVYLQNRSPISPAGKTAIIVDDGIATGFTMKAAIKALRQQKPAKIVVAVPVMPADTAAELRSEVDDIVALDTPEFYLGSVGAYYDNFPQVSDQEVIKLLSY
jgi:predicted phosphoribosyltransferase